MSSQSRKTVYRPPMVAAAESTGRTDVESVEAFLARGGRIEKLDVTERATPINAKALMFRIRKDGRSSGGGAGRP